MKDNSVLIYICQASYIDTHNFQIVSGKLCGFRAAAHTVQTLKPHGKSTAPCTCGSACTQLHHFTWGLSVMFHHE